MAQQKIVLSGSERLITNDDKGVYQVIEGTLLVYLAPFDNDTMGRKYLIGEIGVGEYVPSFCYVDYESQTWKFVLMGLGSTTLKLFPSCTEFDIFCTKFAEKIQLSNADKLGFDEALAELYRLLQVKDDAFIYQTEKDQKGIYEQGLKEIYSVFHRTKSATNKKSKNQQYNAAAFLCEKLKMNIATYETVSSICGSRFDIEDIARLSNFIVRKITLEDQWYKKDVGSFLAFDASNGQPVVVEQVGYHRYVLHDSTTGSKEKLTSRIANKLGETGYIFYKPLPEKKLTWLDVGKYVLSMLNRRDFFVYLIMAVLGTLIGLVLPEMNRKLFDEYIPYHNRSGLIQAGLLILSFSVSNILFGITKGLAAFRYTSAPRYSLDGAIYHRLLNLPQHVLSSMDSGEIASRVMGLGEVICSIVDMLLTNGLALLLSILYLIRMCSYSSVLALPSILMVLFYLVVSVLLAQRQLKYNQSELKIRGELNSDLYQYLLGIAKIRMAGSEKNALYRYLRKFIEFKRIDHKGNKLGLLSSTVSAVASAAFTIVLYVLVVNESTAVSSGTFMAFNSAFGSFSAAIMSVAGMAISFQQMKPILQRADFLIKNESEVEKGAEKVGNISGDIEINNVCFAYSKDEGNVINNLTLHIKPGEYIGIVGASGSGKSTLLKLLLGFEVPTIGKIYYDGKDIVSIDKRELRKRMGVVLQNGSLISGTIQENISITNPNIPYERIEEVLRQVGLEKDISYMPMGLHTVLSEDGSTISGGQRQRILIARALVSDPAIILFDEATSALDNITQNIVCDTLKALRTTRIVIAHRLSTIQNCDRIIVMDHGTIVEEGTYKFLMDKKGIFYTMAKRQIA